MAKIRAHEFITLDGVFESPSWTFEFGFDPAMGEDLGALTGASSTILLGRRTHEMFAPAWRERTVEDDPGAPFFNDTEKLVVGSREPAEEWANTTRFGPYDADKLRELKESHDGDIYLSGSGMLVRGLIADGLLDELHLFVSRSRSGRVNGCSPTSPPASPWSSRGTTPTAPSTSAW
jgi:dihydrofolate reductase